MTEAAPYNPLDKVHLAESVAKALLNQDVHPLAPPRFLGAGLYAIYYSGPFAAYERIANANADGACLWPIYVGRAVPAGTRTASADADASSTALSTRLGQHRKSIDAAENLEVKDFACRYLVVDPLWIPLGESLLLSRFRPLWNVKVDGFGIHDPGSGRSTQKRSSWDTLHPGRAFAMARPENERTSEELASEIKTYLDALDVPEKLSLEEAIPE